MSWLIATHPNLKRKPFSRFLIVFSLCSLTIAGVVWACADSGDDLGYSAFAPEAFVAKQYTPFFYDDYSAYYGMYSGEDNSNTRYNDKVVAEWFDHYHHQFSKEALQYLLLKASTGEVDSVYRNYNGTLKSLPPKCPPIHTGTLNKADVNAFFNYLQLAKKCEQYTIGPDYYGWDKVQPLVAPAKLEPVLLNAFAREHDPFIKQRLWFQLVRYYYFMPSANAKSLTVFNKYRSQFPKNLIYYRALGYVAGYYYDQENYALSNYLYSRCYDYAYEMMIPSKWSFHPQEEEDWNATLKMAKNPNEKITLWHMLGMHYDAGRAIKEITAINPKSEKLDLLLSRIVNMREDEGSEWRSSATDSLKRADLNDRHLVEAIANKNNTAKPYYWNLAAGYLNFLDSNYTAAGKFYAIAKKQYPTSDKMAAAQGKLLDIWLYVKKLKKINAKTEAELVEPLTWLINPKKAIPDESHLRSSIVLDQCQSILGSLYHKQGDAIKAICFYNGYAYNANQNIYHLDSAQVQALINLLNKSNKTPFEQVMVRYYPHKVDKLYYHQAMELTYKEEFAKALERVKKIKLQDTLLGNPFNSRMVDCHDCDHEAPQKQKFTTLSFIQTLLNIKTDIRSGKNVYRNAYLMANAYYNITYYGNGRTFYENDATGITDVTKGEEAESSITSMNLAVKYYLLARNNATTAEQKARCTFMLGKCEQNQFYNQKYAGMSDMDKYYNYIPRPPAGKYFAELKDKYAATAYYQEVLQECGYFSYYIKNGK